MNASKLPDPQFVNGTEAPDLRAELERILASPSFRGSRRSSDFLRYVVEATAAGRTDDLKERTLGVAVFGRAADYDTNQDPIVRNTAGQVRRRLAQYYMEAGENAEIRIDLPSGSYVPEISRLKAAPVAPATEERPPAARPRRVIALAVVLLLAAAAGLWQWQRSRPGDVQRFWSPLLRQPGAVVLCVGQGHTYKLGPEWDRRFEEALLKGAIPEGPVPLTDVVPAWDRYVALTDVRALLRLTHLFTSFGKAVDLRGGRSTSLEDLRRRPVVLVGALNNDWTLSLTGELRFYFESEPGNKLDLVRDRQRPGYREWAVRSDIAPASVTSDYAIVTRVFNPTTEQAVVVAAGIKGGGTYSASEFLTSPAYLERALANAPSDWANKNMQFVLEVRMFSGSPGPPRVVAAHFWDRH